MIDAKKIDEVEAWLIKENIDDIEIMVPDVAGTSRGKAMPRHRFIEGMKTNNLRMPESIFGITVNGGFVFNDVMQETEVDIILIPDLDTICVAPWQKEPCASVVCSAVYENGSPVLFSPRQALQQVLDLYTAKGWKPVVAPEFEFYLIDKQDDMTRPPQPPKGKSGIRDTGTQPYSIDGVDEFEDFFEEVYDFCEKQNINIDTLIHEAGPSQFEFNVNHGDPMNVADQSFFFKRMLHQTALRHNMFATFMARPYPDTFGSAMHVHQSIVDIKTGVNIFSTEDGEDTPIFMSHIAGLQKYIPCLMPMVAPYVNSYMRLSAQLSSPTNLHWARENRSVGLRVPQGGPESRRIENRIAGSDTNPYLAIAASLAAGYLGMIEKLDAPEEYKGSAYETTNKVLPPHFYEGVRLMENCEELKQVFSPIFLETLAQIKNIEFSSYTNYLSPWETKYLLLQV